MNLRDWRWYAAYGLVIGLVVLGVWRLLAPWGYDPGFLLGFLLTQGAAVLVGFVMHEGLHLWAALTQGVSAGSVKAGWFRFWVLEPVEVGTYRRIVLAPLMLPVLVGLLLAVVAPVRLALSAALLWLLGSADDLADWVRLWGVSGAVTNRPGEGLRLEAKR
ncbi:hypothetical protein [Anaerolinea thermophila]|uniref:Hypothetical membrane protein n=1 Tax=Anaerolinea thermophila (strain DSM 14523 / JCM 11388 / NBRC 100420 / UNI-1) TaxID=926569 RepID=E8MYW9_ANATU|nr:hypothetical protein [Anaerolinea thermophila]BAJ64455.1 hypothetical membrane protein [Anaerolinea thermophila UNI-1]